MTTPIRNVFDLQIGGVKLSGVLGGALDGNRDRHLSTFIQDEQSPPIALFCPDHRDHNDQGDWYGEHAGKWLSATAKRVERTGDSLLSNHLRRVADYLISVQGPDGYLGTYAASRRFMCRKVERSLSWDGAPGQRTWDVWVESYMVLGLLDAGRALAHPGCIAAARKIGDLCWRTFGAAGFDITTLGNHHGLSATVLLEPAVELYQETGAAHYLELAELILQRTSEFPPLQLLPQALAEVDAAHIATGKAYQLIWMLVGLVKLYRVTGHEPYLRGACQVWENIRRHHLTLGGGPWGGVGHRSREVFNPRPVFSPYGYVETCSTFSWIQLNRELLALTGEAKYADEIEKSAYNDLLGAQSPAGDNWCYYSFPNGKRVYTTYWRCCKSSGPWAIEEIPASVYGLTSSGGIAINLYGPGSATLPLTHAGNVEIVQTTQYPFDGQVVITVAPERVAKFELRLRIPGWVEHPAVTINREAVDLSNSAGNYIIIDRTWTKGDSITLNLPMVPQLHRQTNRNIQESKAPDGSLVAQEVLHFDYAAITRGPLVYATGLIDDFKIEETVRLPETVEKDWLETLSVKTASGAPVVRLNFGYRPPLTFSPYFEAGGREDGAWRITWLQLAPAECRSGKALPAG